MPYDKDWHDWYDILRIPSSASSAEIQKAYRKAASDEHPDASGHPDAHGRVKLVNEAGEVLRDAKAKAQFDFERAWRLSQSSKRVAELEKEVASLESSLQRAQQQARKSKQRADAAEPRYEYQKERANQAEQRFSDLAAQIKKCKRRFHCIVCTESDKHGYPSDLYYFECNIPTHCRACFELQHEANNIRAKRAAQVKYDYSAPIPIPLNPVKEDPMKRALNDFTPKRIPTKSRYSRSSHNSAEALMNELYLRARMDE